MPIARHVSELLLIATLGLPVWLAGCAQTTTPPPAAAMGQPSISYGRIVSIRSLQGQGSDVRGTILGAVAGGVAGTVPVRGAGGSPPVEFIIREDTGQTVSVVQTNEADFRPGDPVALTRGARTSIARQGAPAS